MRSWSWCVPAAFVALLLPSASLASPAAPAVLPSTPKIDAKYNIQPASRVRLIQQKLSTRHPEVQPAAWAVTLHPSGAIPTRELPYGYPIQRWSAKGSGAQGQLVKTSGEINVLKSDGRHGPTKTDRVELCDPRSMISRGHARRTVRAALGLTNSKAYRIAFGPDGKGDFVKVQVTRLKDQRSRGGYLITDRHAKYKGTRRAVILDQTWR